MQQLAIVILNYNGRAHLQTFLPSVVRNLSGHTLVVVDNGSTDDSVHFLHANFPEIEVIKLPKNLGFAQGYNDGLAFLEGKYEHYLLLNSDVEVTEHYLAPLLAQLQDEKIGAVQPKILSYTNKKQFEHAGASGGFLDRRGFPFCRGRIFNACEEDHGQYDNAIPVFWASGACIMVRASLFHRLKGFDGHFFAHMEEIDLCWRMQHLGFQIWVEPKSTVFHLGGGTLSYDAPRKVFLNFRNNLFMMAKNENGFWPMKIFIRMVWDGIAALQFLVSGKPKLLVQVLKAHLCFYGALPRLLRQREKPVHTELRGRYRGHIVIDYFLNKKNKYSDLKL